MVSYNVIVGDTFSKVLSHFFANDDDDSFVGSREFAIVLATLLVSLPLSLYK
jgi:amino acid permease